MTSPYQPVSESVFLKKFALDAYNKKYQMNIQQENCFIKSIRPSYGYDLGYRIETIRGDDNVAIHLYVNFAKTDRVDLVRVENEQNQYFLNSVADEVYVVLGEVSMQYKDNGIYAFRWIKGPEMLSGLLTFMTGDYIQVNGDSVLARVDQIPTTP